MVDLAQPLVEPRVEWSEDFAMFAVSRELALLDHFRTPYTVIPELGSRSVQRLVPLQGEAQLLWPSADPEAEPIAAALHAGDGRSVRVFAPVLAAPKVESLLSSVGGNWTEDLTVAGPDGEPISCTWRGDDGSVFLPFDPDEMILSCWSERYARVTRGSGSRRVKHAMMVSYYRLRPLLPRAVQIAARRRFARVQARSRFPCWPIETALHDFFDLMFETLGTVAGQPVPRIAPWPYGHTWALVLTHDVEQAEGLAAIDRIIELEQRHGMRSSWNLVPHRYDVDRERVRKLLKDGFEVGVHGSHHDGRDLESIATLQERLPGMRKAAWSWKATGFRSPAMHRDWALMPQLGFDYDSSYPDTDPFEPQAGGCCTWLPFFNQGTVELPLTLQQDHTLFVILRHRDERAWIQKAEFLRERGGLALIDTHPDYMVDERIITAYDRLLGHFADDETAWRALPRDVSAWWRSRAASRLQRRDGAWEIVGPAAAAARVELVSGG